MKDAINKMCADAYWYAELTGDYEMSDVEDESWYISALKKLEDLLRDS